MPTITLDRDEEATGELRLRRASERARDDFDVDGDVEDGILPAPPREEPNKEPCDNDQDTAGTTEQSQEKMNDVGPLIRFRRELTPPRRFDLLQQWEGVITEVVGDGVWAEIMDLTSRLNPSEVVEIPVAEFAVADRSLLEPGNVFYWSIGYETSSGGTIRRVSEIRMRRTAAWSERMIESLKAKARQMYGSYGNQEDEPTTAQ